MREKKKIQNFLQQKEDEINTQERNVNLEAGGGGQNQFYLNPIQLLNYTTITDGRVGSGGWRLRLTSETGITAQIYTIPFLIYTISNTCAGKQINVKDTHI